MPIRPNSHRLRHGRFSEPGRAYMVTTVVHQRMPLFQDWRLGRLLVAELKRVHDEGQVDSLAFVVMPNHMHWLVQLRNQDLAPVMQTIKSRSTLSINRAIDRSGAFWQSGYHDRAIRDGEDLRPFADYLLANPLRAGLVTDLADYPLWDASWL
ncbi:transposase [Pseudomonas sp. SZMC_28357]|uniref:REP-associated tyrosine transposase n=1 Tax=Pseudomonas sp. SZMC_28357 TaxID=3074380 RepID=UPI0028712FDC|nr:transposase [Pseudomonas sp. SZMC_28357]MDR9754027.1 transposase [Pseudomonas sp. SZMC_28357]